VIIIILSTKLLSVMVLKNILKNALYLLNVVTYLW